MSNILIKRCCIAVLAGTAVSMNMNVQGARADFLDDIVRQCIRESQSRPLNPREIQYCNQQIALKRHRNNLINNRNIQYRIYLQGLQTQQRILEQGANPIIIRPTDFGIRNR